MIFAAPAYGWLAVPVAMIFLLALRGERNRQTDLQQLAEPPLLSRLLPTETPFNTWLRLAVPLFGALLLVAALMRPQWGIVEELHATVGLDIIVALDVSRSMLADDLVPTRLSVAKKALGQLLDNNTGDRIGVLAFAGTAFLVCPLTTDHAIVRQMLAEVGPETMPKGGSSLAAALVEADRAFRATSPGGRVLLVLSDGEDHAGGITPVLESLRRDGIAIIAARSGTRDGGLIPLSSGTFVRDRAGAVVKSRANKETLQILTPAVIDLKADGSGLKPLLDKVRTESRESARQQKQRKLAERFQYPLAMALLLFSLSLLPARRRHP